VPRSIGGAWSLSDTMSPGPKLISLPIATLIRPVVWPQYTNVTDRQDRTGQDRQNRQADNGPIA